MNVWVVLEHTLCVPTQIVVPRVRPFQDAKRQQSNFTVTRCLSGGGLWFTAKYVFVERAVAYGPMSPWDASALGSILLLSQ
jgi:hypothetical protein